VNRDNTVVVGGKIFQIEPTRWRGTLARKSHQELEKEFE